MNKKLKRVSTRQMPQVYAIKDIGPYDIYTTIVIPPGHDPSRPLRGFCYSVGASIPGTTVPACRADTNMMVPGVLVDEEMKVEAIRWRVPSVALGKFQADGQDYTVNKEDVENLLAKVRLTSHTEGDQAGCFLVPLDYTQADGALGVGRTCPVETGKLGRLEQFWVELDFPGGSLTRTRSSQHVVALCGERSRGVQ